ncbi:hypothetical protein Aca07nite_64610 [Actinoplanes capillaceus]|uniref:Uncharacterized protein n=1 Tax=Actinoplanes campanulatus TaxID=113559 RepID=A0ABQ3WSC3_9ACTN|nr:hypothetical protein [Actinoplanes capillaceus]GID49186.1 hypothetical protein Aca07nite_64610 [Actinoplanes capillaceus]
MTASSTGAAESTAPHSRTGRWSIGAVLGTAVGLAPHLLHHVGLFAGTALVAGLGGTILFAGLGLATMTPMLLRLRRRFGSWWAPGVAVLLFAAMFAGSTLVIGPVLRDAVDGAPQPGPSHSTPAGEHTVHHG